MPANGGCQWSKWGKCSTRRIMDYSQTKCLILSFLCALSAARAEGEIIFRIDPLGLEPESTTKAALVSSVQSQNPEHKAGESA